MVGQKPNGLSYHFVPVFNDPNIDIANATQAKAAIKGWLDGRD